MQAEATTPERKFALIKVRPGDYLLPGNDRVTLWRIARYEDGKSHGLEHGPNVVYRWHLLKWHRPIPTDEELQRVDPDQYDLWESVESGFESRAEAIKESLRLSNG